MRSAIRDITIGQFPSVRHAVGLIQTAKDII